MFLNGEFCRGELRRLQYVSLFLCGYRRQVLGESALSVPPAGSAPNVKKQAPGKGGGRMRCANCGFESLSGASFCGACGDRLSHSCQRCGYEASLSAKFCSECGAPLTDAPATPSPRLPPVSEPSPAPILYTPPLPYRAHPRRTGGHGSPGRDRR